GCVTTLGPTLKETFPEVKDFTRCSKSTRVFSHNDNHVQFTRVFSVDSTFFKLFTFPLVKGGYNNLLSKPNTIVLTESSSKALFGNEDPIGKTILQGQVPFLIEAIAKDPPKNSHLKFEMLISFVTDLNDPNYCKNCNNRPVYVLLEANARPEQLQGKMNDIVKKLHPEGDVKREYAFQPVSDIHLHSNLRFEHEQNGNARSVVTLTIVAVLILFIAWLNYINLTTSISINRSAEVGIRLVNGSTRKNLLVQFLMESFLVNSISLMIAIVLAQLVFPIFNSLTNIHASFTLLANGYFWLTMIVILFLGSVIYGFYPAFIVSSFKPIQALKGKTLLPGGVYAMRRALVFLQFSFSIILIAGTLTIFRQVSFMKNKDLGMNIDQTFVVPVPNEMRDNGDGFEVDLSQYSDSKPITYASTIPGQQAGNVGGGFIIENAPTDQAQQVYFFYINKNYFHFLDIGFVAGQGFISDQLNNDKNTEIIINDAARVAFGFDSPEDALGKLLYQNQAIVGRIHGVVRNHHNQSLDVPVAPAYFQYTKGKGFYLVKTDPASLDDDRARIEKAFEKNYPNNFFEFYFLDEYFNRQYTTHIQFGKVFGVFTLLAIFIAVLGLSGLSLYVIKVRSKEIALRKVLGATVVNLLLMLSREYVKITVAAFIFAAPIGYYLLDKWLQEFSHRIPMSGWMLIVPAMAILFISLLTVGVQSLRTALAQPADKLRND
ncbi:MAG TPA: FtsX-like permease family protein, partial [Chryseolinea sp.]|nr:FtsX-like permease family protein [Chryseolinea sp.]